MQAVILAAGKSTRTWPLTAGRPKPLLKVLNRTLLEHNLDQLTGLVDEVIIIVGFMKERITERFGKRHKGLKLTFVDQEKTLGTGHALMTAKPRLRDRFLALNGDDLYAHVDFERLLRYRYAALAMEVDDVRHFGAHIVEGDRIIDHVEKPTDMIRGRCNIGCYVFDKEIFEIELQPSPRGEFEITDYLGALARRKDVRSVLLKGYWLPIPFAWKLLDCTEFLLGGDRKGRITQGKDCKIEDAALRGFVVLGDRCEIGKGSLIENSIVMDHVQIGRQCVIRDSIIGENVVIGNRVETQNEDAGREIRSRIKAELVNTGRRKLGAVVGDDTIIERAVVTLPGVKIGPGRHVHEGTHVAEDIEGREGEPT